MKTLFYYCILLMTIMSCKTELVKWEFTKSPTISESGDFTSSGLSIHKTITENDIAAKLDLDNVDLKTLKITYADVLLELLNVPQADSVKFELYCDAIPFKPTHTGTVAIKPGITLKVLNEEKIKLGPVSIGAITFVNNTLDGVINNGNVIKFNLLARTVPPGALITGRANVLINFNATFWKCIEKPEFTVFSDENKGLCN
ncbi:MAG: hypothetical protein LKG19_01335 [Saprospiraceae bacterium]|jgi:hypothetical protein|nr:hypothetical protein [Saprospiraceae bacterium]MCI1265182.1 hypothetical protein [Saprospiraceae bacterium]